MKPGTMDLFSGNSPAASLEASVLRPGNDGRKSPGEASSPAETQSPLADRARPEELDGFVGQDQIIGQGRILREQIEGDRVSSMIFYGPSGTGKTTLARIVANRTGAVFRQLNAVTAKVADVRDCIAEARTIREATGRSYILFIDEIHRFNKAQQDSLLPAVESGEVILIGATTENPWFSINTPLLSRVTVYSFEPLSEQEISSRTEEVASRPELNRFGLPARFGEGALSVLSSMAAGDMRKALNILERAEQFVMGRRFETGQGEDPEIIAITRDDVLEAAQSKHLWYDRASERHYDNISAFIKSMRGSDPDAVALYLARMIEAGEDPEFIARRIVIAAAEDVGLADPIALVVANAAFEAVSKVGMPEGRIILSEAAIYVACAPKSNSAYLAIDRAIAHVRKGDDGRIPSSLTSSPRTGFEGAFAGAGKGTYSYPHDHPDGFVEQQYTSTSVRFFSPNARGHEEKLKIRLRRLWKNRDY